MSDTTKFQSESTLSLLHASSRPAGTDVQPFNDHGRAEKGLPS